MRGSLSLSSWRRGVEGWLPELDRDSPVPQSSSWDEGLTDARDVGRIARREDTQEGDPQTGRSAQAGGSTRKLRAMSSAIVVPALLNMRSRQLTVMITVAFEPGGQMNQDTSSMTLCGAKAPQSF
jgi:hypothetical protein